MKPKISEKKEATRLRLRGRSLNEIATQLGISKASASVWLRDIQLSKRARQAIQKKRQKARQRSADTHHTQTRARLEESASLAKVMVADVHIDQRLSCVICALMYWCEGEKTKNDKTLTFANSDPRLVATFLHLFRKSFDVDERKFRVCLHLHGYHKENKQIRFWSRVTGISTTQFLKTYHKSNTGKRTREGYAGCASIRYYDTRIARQIQALARATLQKYGPIVQW